MNEKQQVKSLWKLCFNDDDSFIDLYFSERYTAQRNMALYEGEQVIAALQMIPYEMTFKGDIIKASYISGASTHPDFRNKGKMNYLLKLTHKRMFDMGAAISFLIPAEEWLFDYYAKSGYRTMFFSKIIEQEIEPSNKRESISIEIGDDIDNEMFDYFNEKMLLKPCAILHSFEALSVVMHDLVMAGGKVVLSKKEGVICGVAFILPVDDKLIVKEIIADSPAIKKEMLGKMAANFNADRMVYRDFNAHDVKPYGMIRVVNVEKMLSIYAKSNPTLNVMIEVSGDNSIQKNNGLFILKDGNCIRIKHINQEEKKNIHEAKDGNVDDILKLDISQLVESLYKDEHPYMKLMMD